MAACLHATTRNSMLCTMNKVLAITLIVLCVASVAAYPSVTLLEKTPVPTTPRYVPIIQETEDRYAIYSEGYRQGYTDKKNREQYRVQLRYCQSYGDRSIPTYNRCAESDRVVYQIWWY